MGTKYNTFVANLLQMLRRGEHDNHIWHHLINRKQRRPLLHRAQHLADRQREIEN